MGKRKPVPKRNANPTVSEAVIPVPITDEVAPTQQQHEDDRPKKRRIIIDDK